MDRQPVRVLLIEDSESDYLLTRHLLGSIENQIFDLEWASSWQMGIEAIRRAGHDICLLDYRIGGGNGLELLRETRAVSQHFPVILLTGVSDYRLAVEAMQLGAADFLLKDQLTPPLLERSIRYAIALARSKNCNVKETDCGLPNFAFGRSFNRRATRSSLPMSTVESFSGIWERRPSLVIEKTKSSEPPSSCSCRKPIVNGIASDSSDIDLQGDPSWWEKRSNSRE